MGIRIIKNIKTLMELLSLPFKKGLSGEYYTNKSIKSIFYVNNYVQEKQAKNILNKPAEHIMLTKQLYVHSDNSRQPSMRSDLIVKTNGQLEISSKEANNLTSRFNLKESEQPDVNIRSSVQRLKLTKENKQPLQTNPPYEKVKSMISCGTEGPEKVDTATQPKKLSDNPKFLGVVQKLENQLKNSLESNSKNTALLSSKNKEKEEEQACKKDVLPLTSSFGDLPVELEIKLVVFSDNNSPMPPPPPPIGGLANFKGLKLPLSPPMQSKKETQQKDNISQNKVNIKSNLNSSVVEELKSTLEERKEKAYSV
ncbi:hypothetical protein [Candidatus Mesenet endosymbiont of Agriotes lineatus]|uniref:hypothetical protein n=1 Tax=Candidatus Mesenet endosymbiont of Agriotes lineatus TaxID=3077948 RepID=UPI0030D53ABC